MPTAVIQINVYVAQPREPDPICHYSCVRKQVLGIEYSEVQRPPADRPTTGSLPPAGEPFDESITPRWPR